jgi:hypothetical protein
MSIETHILHAGDDAFEDERRLARLLAVGYVKELREAVYAEH